MDLRLVLGQCPGLIIIGSTAPMFKRTEPGEAMSTGASSSTIANHDSYIELEKHLNMGLVGTLTLKGQKLAMMLLGIDMVLVLVPNS